MTPLFRAVQKLASEHPELRPHLVPVLRRHADIGSNLRTFLEPAAHALTLAIREGQDPDGREAVVNQVSAALMLIGKALEKMDMPKAKHLMSDTANRLIDQL